MDQATPPRKRRVRTVMYLDPDIRRRLKRERGETDRPVGAIVEEILAAHFDGQSPPRPHAEWGT